MRNNSSVKWRIKREAFILTIPTVAAILFILYAAKRNNGYTQQSKAIAVEITNLDSNQALLQKTLDTLPTDYITRLYNYMTARFVDLYVVNGDTVSVNHSDYGRLISKFPEAEKVLIGQGWFVDYYRKFLPRGYDWVLTDRREGPYPIEYADVPFGLFKKLLLNEEYRMFLPGQDSVTLKDVRNGWGYNIDVWKLRHEIPKEIDSIKEVISAKRNAVEINNNQQWSNADIWQKIKPFIVSFLCIYVIRWLIPLGRKIKKEQLRNLPIIFLVCIIFLHVLFTLNKTYNGLSREQISRYIDAQTVIMYFGVIPLWVHNLFYVIYFFYALWFAVWLKNKMGIIEKTTKQE